MERKQITIPNKPDTEYLEKLSDLHKAMGDYTRMKILWKLMGGEVCVGDLAKEIGITESAVSHQLRALKIARLIRCYKVGKNVFYVLEDEHIKWIMAETYAHILEQ